LGVESTIIITLTKPFTVLRLGDVSLESVRAVYGQVKLLSVEYSKKKLLFPEVNLGFAKS
jgi:hypothetical protein